LASFKVPERIDISADPLPRNAAGKVQKDLLQMTYEELELDHQRPGFNIDALDTWRRLRAGSKVVHSTAHEGFWITPGYAEIDEIAHRPESFSSLYVTVPRILGVGDVPIPPLNLDPPQHGPIKHLLSSAFSPPKVAALEPVTRQIVNASIDTFVSRGECDAAQDFARTIPTSVICRLFGLGSEMDERCDDWVHRMVDLSGDEEAAMAAGFELIAFFGNLVQERKSTRGDDLISYLLEAEVEGRRLDDGEIVLSSVGLLLAGIDTTWSVLSGSLMHLALHPDQQQTLRDRPDLLTTAREEFLRFYAPVTVARQVVEDTEFRGCPFKAGDMVLMPFPSANHDQQQFDDPDDVVLDRSPNRHLAFGVGIHRCVGSNLARMELSMALEEFLRRIPAFRLTSVDDIEWSTGPMRGPRRVPLVFEPAPSSLAVGSRGPGA
jgi:cytochrome P450